MSLESDSLSYPAADTYALSWYYSDIAVADKKALLYFLVFLSFPGFVSLCEFLLSGITWFIFA